MNAKNAEKKSPTNLLRMIVWKCLESYKNLINSTIYFPQKNEITFAMKEIIKACEKLRSKNFLYRNASTTIAKNSPYINPIFQKWGNINHTYGSVKAEANKDIKNISFILFWFWEK